MAAQTKKMLLFHTVSDTLRNKPKAKPKIKNLLPLSLFFLLLAGCEFGQQTEPASAPNSALMENPQTLQNLESIIRKSLKDSGQSSIQPSTGVRLLSSSSIAVSDASPSSSMFSTTTLAESGVDEGDLVKNDDQFLYVTHQSFFGDSGSAINIFKMQEAPAQAIYQGSVQLGQLSVNALYVRGDQSSRELTVISGAQGWGYAGWYRMGYWGGNSSFDVALFDVTHPSSVEKNWSVNIDGTYLDSRSINNKLYIVSRYYPHVKNYVAYPVDYADAVNNQELIDETPVQSLLPTRRVNGSNEATLHIEADQCVVPKDSATNQSFMPFIVTITTIDLNNPDGMDVSCVLGEDSGLYVSTENLYLFNQNSWDKTFIHKFEFTPDGARYRASGQVDGSLGWNNPHLRFSEYGGFLRVMTTRWSWLNDVIAADGNVVIDSFCCTANYEHSLHVMQALGTKLVEVATLPNESRPETIGEPGEDLYGVRFQGDRAYAVTYRRTDPLYAIDLSNPLDPKITGALKIPGFSSYIHPLGDNFILGIGNDSVEEGDLSFTQGVKVGLFDVSQLDNPRLVKQDIIGKRGSYSPVSYDYHALTLVQSFDADHYKLVVPVQVHEGNIAWLSGDSSESSAYYDWNRSIFRFYDVDLTSDQGFASGGDLVVDSSTSDRSWSQNYFFRSVIFGGSVHSIYGDSIWSSSWQSPSNAVPASSASP